MGGAAERGGVAGRVHVHDVGADGDVHGRGQAEPPRGGQQAHLQVARARATLGEVAARPRRRGPGRRGRPRPPRGSPPRRSRAPCRRRPCPRPASTSSEVCPATASSKSWTMPAPFRAMPVTRPRSIRSIRTGERPTLMHVRAQAPDDGAAAGPGPQDLVAQVAQRLAGQHPRQAVEEGGEGGALAVRTREGGPRAHLAPAAWRAGRSRPRRGRGAERPVPARRAAPSARCLLDDLAEHVDHHARGPPGSRCVSGCGHVDQVVDEPGHLATPVRRSGRR